MGGIRLTLTLLAFVVAALPAVGTSDPCPPQPSSDAEAKCAAEGDEAGNGLTEWAVRAAGQPVGSAPPTPDPKDGSGPTGTVVLGFMRNYETVKLSVGNPEVHQIVILAMVGLLAWLMSHRSTPTPLLDRQQTEQLKGLGILFVILGHLWTHVSLGRPLVVLGADGVTIFLMISGFGLMISSGNRRPDAKTFAVRRLMRVMLPYWLATVVILALDAVMLGRLPRPVDLALTLLGVNVSEATRHLDYVRWFITFILLWYGLFYMAVLLRDKTRLNPVLFLFSCGLALYLFDHYVYDLAYQEFAFPAGCALARYRGAIRGRFESDRERWVLCAVILVAGGILYKSLMPGVYPRLWPMLLFRLSFQTASLALTAGLIMLLGQMGASGRACRALALLGTLSYELFLLHGPLLIKYNPVFGLLPIAVLPLSFFLLLGILVALAAGLHRMLAKASVWWSIENSPFWPTSRS